MVSSSVVAYHWLLFARKVAEIAVRHLMPFTRKPRPLEERGEEKTKTHWNLIHKVSLARPSPPCPLSLRMHVGGDYPVLAMEIGRELLDLCWAKVAGLDYPSISILVNERKRDRRQQVDVNQ